MNMNHYTVMNGYNMIGDDAYWNNSASEMCFVNITDETKSWCGAKVLRLMVVFVFVILVPSFRIFVLKKE